MGSEHEVMDACSPGVKGYWGIRNEPGHFLNPNAVRFCPRAGTYYAPPLTDPLAGESPFRIGSVEYAFYFDAARLPGTPLIILDVRQVVDGETGEHHYGAYLPENVLTLAETLLEDCLDHAWTAGTHTPACRDAARAFQYKVRTLVDTV